MNKSQLAKLLATENIEVQENAVQTASFDVVNRVLTIPIFKEENESGLYFFICVFIILSSIMSLYWWLFKWCKEKGLYST